MLSKAQIKYIRSLTQQKYRKEYNVFVAEGDKIAREWLESPARIQMIVGTAEWIAQNNLLIKKHPEATVHVTKQDELQAASSLQHPNGALLVVNTPAAPKQLPTNEWCIALDDIQDPGNMGAIIRIADWFGIQHVVCSADCVDVYNAKVVQAAMGGHLRVQLHQVNLSGFLAVTKLPIFAAVLGGDNVYQAPRLNAGILVIGNESKGVSAEIINKATHKITIPQKGGAESLNAAVATGILCALLLPQ